MRTEYLAALITVLLIVDVIVVVTLVRRNSRRRAAPASNTGKNPAAPLLAKIFLSLGLSLTVAAGICAAYIAKNNAADSHADGTVVELVPSGRGGSPRYRARVEFTTAEGTQVRFKSSVSSNPPPAQVGEHVDVRYKPRNPQDATINSYWQVWLLPTLLGIIGGPFLLLGTGFGIVGRAGGPTRRGPERI